MRQSRRKVSLAKVVLPVFIVLLLSASVLAYTVNYNYDAGGQLTNATYPGKVSITYSYDSRYNRTATVIDALPTITITSPTDGAVLNCNIYTVTGTASDNGSVAEVDISFDGGVSWTDNGVSLTTSNGVTSWSYLWYPPESGQYQICARAIDDQAASSTSAFRTVTVTVNRTSTTATSSITRPGSGAVLTGASCDISGTAASNGSGISLVQVSTDGGNSWNAATGTTSWTYHWNLPIGGIRTIRSRAVDSNGNFETPGDGVDVTIRTSAITVPLDNAQLSGTNYTIKGAATLKACGLKEVDVSTDGGTTWSPATFTSGAGTSWSYNWRLPLSEGSVTLKSRAIDNNGNQETTGTSIPVTTINRSATKTAFAWGYGNSGQLGDGATGNNRIPDKVHGVGGFGNLSSIVAITGGYYHSLALNPNGTVCAWGSNNNGQLGDGTTSNRSTPVNVSNLSGVVSIAAGQYHSIALKSDGTVYTCGQNIKGQLGNGNGNTNDRLAFANVSGLSGVAAIAGGGRHTIALKTDGTVWAWGDNTNGQLGNGSSTSYSAIPAQVVGGQTGQNYLTGIVAIAAGDSHSVALDRFGNVWTWGNNSDGQLGNNSTTSNYTPVKVLGLGGSGFLTNIVSIASGYSHTVALQSDGSVWTWGDNSYGQLGINSTVQSNTPVLVLVMNSSQNLVNLSNVVAIASGYYHTIALTGNSSGGGVLTWGRNNDYQLGNNSAIPSSIPVSVLAPTGSTGSLTNVVAIAGGGFHTLALQYSGSGTGGLPQDYILPSSTISPLVPATLSNCTSYTITGSAAQGNHGLQYVEVSTDGGTTWNMATGTTSWSYTWTIPAAGPYVVMSRATDSYNNQEIPASGKNVAVMAALSATRPSIDLHYYSVLPPPITSVGITSSPLSVGGNVSTTTPTWLTVSPSSGTTPVNVSININPPPGGFGIGNYTSTVTFTSPYGTANNGTTNTLSIPVTLGYYAPITAPDNQHYSWDYYFNPPAGVNCGICHASSTKFLPSDYKESQGICISCHNAESVAHNQVIRSGGHPIFVNASAGGGKWPTYGSYTAAEKNNMPYSGLKNGTSVVCSTCHNSMGKFEDYGRAWEQTSSSDRYTYYLLYGGWSTSGYFVPTVYRTSPNPIAAPSYSKSRNSYVVNPSEYTYDEVAGSITFKAQQATNAYIYVTLDYPYLRASSYQNNLCSDCHTQSTHKDTNCLVCHAAHNSSNLASIRNAVRTPNRTTTAVKFLNYSKANSFADGDTTHDGICEVCHSKTNYYRYDGSTLNLHNGGKNYNGTNCTICHQHRNGFTTYTGTLVSPQDIAMPSGGDILTPDGGGLTMDAPAPLDSYSIP